MRQALTRIRAKTRKAEASGKEVDPEVIGEILHKRLPKPGAKRERFFRELGVFVSAALAGTVIDPEQL